MKFPKIHPLLHFVFGEVIAVILLFGIWWFGAYLSIELIPANNNPYPYDIIIFLLPITIVVLLCIWLSVKSYKMQNRTYLASYIAIAIFSAAPISNECPTWSNVCTIL
jgi:hypothetical protein